MRRELEPHMPAGRDFLAANYHALLADEPGLCKTAQVLAAAEKVHVNRALIICPASVREHWRAEIRLEGLDDRHWDVVSYEQATRGLSFTTAWDLLVMDEAHYLKGMASQRTRAILGRGGYATRARYKWALTGTPVLNRPVELYPLLKTLHPGFASMNFATYAQRYCGGYWDGREFNVRGATNLDELGNKLRDFMLRRTKREVYPDRKAALVKRVPLQLYQDDLDAIWREETALGIDAGDRAISQGAGGDRWSQLGDTSKLLHAIGLAKVGAAVLFVEDLLETVEKVVVFAHHLDVIDGLYAAFHNRGFCPVVYAGGMDDKRKQETIKAFQNPCGRVFIGQRQAAGTGIDGLQRVCSTAVIVEPSWVPAETEQLIGRLDRVGQQDDLVNAYVLYAPGTIDEAVVAASDRKEQIVDRVVNRPAPGSMFGLIQ